MLRPEIEGWAYASVDGGTATGSGSLGFDISLDFVNPPTAGQAAAFNAAEAIWESVIDGYVENPGITAVEIEVNLTAIDGPGMILGSAGPTFIRAESAVADFFYASEGIMRFDTDDLAGLESTGRLDDVILHEMGHVLGIGTLWDLTSFGSNFQQVYVDGTGAYTGAGGIAAYQAEYDPAATFIPVELDGGPGSANGHWNEASDWPVDDENVIGFDTDPGDGGPAPTVIDPTSLNFGRSLDSEIMTGRLSFNSYLSETTRQSFADIGYVIAPPSLQGDFDGDGDIDFDDFGVFVLNYQDSPEGGPPFAEADFDFDGDVDFDDFGVFVLGFQSFQNPAVAVPEPAGGALLAVAAFGVLARSAGRTR